MTMQVSSDKTSELCCPNTNLSGVCAGMDTQQTAVLIAVVVRGGIVHPMMPTTDEKSHKTISKSILH